VNERSKAAATSTAAVDTSLVQGVLQQVARRVVGQEYMVERLLISLLTGACSHGNADDRANRNRHGHIGTVRHRHS